MAEIAQSIDLDLPTKLGDREYRRLFFRAEASAKIAQQLIELRKRRDLTQARLAELAGTGQPAISRCERADYQNWTISTLRSITDALDGRLRVIIEAAEDVLPEYESVDDARDPDAPNKAQAPKALEGPSAEDAMRPQQQETGPSALKRPDPIVPPPTMDFNRRESAESLSR